MEQVTIIGIDISKRSFQLHGATAEGKPVFGKKLSREKFPVFLSEAPPCLVVMEACGGAHYWGRQIIALGHTCKLIPPIYVKPFLKRQKNDSNDAAAIVEAAQRCPSHLYHLSQKPWNFASPPDTLSGMHKIIEIFADRAALHTEILALRQQVAVLKRQRPRPSLRKADRVFWVILSCLWPGWRHALVIVRPETVIGWHRKGFRLFWTWKWRRGKLGRPPVSREIRHLVRRMSRENTRWGAPRIHGELLKLGFSISQAAVSKYMVRYPSPPSQSWRTFLTNHADCLASIDFFVVPTATFHLLFGFIVLHHERRQIVHFGVTANPTMAWVAQQIREAFPWGTAPRYLIRDRDGAYGQSFRSTVTAMGVEEVVTAPRSPWQNPYVERLIGSVRRECLDHSIILNERHLRRILGSYLDYYHGSRTHLSLGKDTPDGRPVQPAGSGTVVSLPKVGGLHHRYERLAA